jgi:hypothetical protein
MPSTLIGLFARGRSVRQNTPVLRGLLFKDKETKRFLTLGAMEPETTKRLGSKLVTFATECGIRAPQYG